MRERALRVSLVAWAIVTLALAVASYVATAPTKHPPPPRDASIWAIRALERFRRGEPIPEAPSSAATHRAPAPIVVLAFDLGQPVARSVGGTTLESAVRRAIATFGRHPAFAPGTDMRTARDGYARFSITVPLGDGATPVDVPILRDFAYVPLRDALVVRFRGEEATLVPDEMVAAGLVRGAIATGLPDLDVGIPIDRASATLAERLGVDAASLRREGRFSHRRVRTLSADAYPRRVEATLEEAHRGVAAAARYLVRQMGDFGFFAYEIDASTGNDLARGYLLARHAGAAYFLAQAARIEHLPAAQLASERAIDAMLRQHGRYCGRGRLCFEEMGDVDGGTAALALIAAAELHRIAPTEARRTTIREIAEFLLSLQRPDGEFMHRYDLRAARPIDVQLPYFSGEMALALLRADEVLREPRYLFAAERALRHLATRSWSFPASRYVHAEEHWTCVAAGETRGRIAAREVLDFCASVFAWNEWAELRPGDSPFGVDGAYGLGPLLAPRFPALGTRIESFVELHRAFVFHDRDVPGMRALLARGARAILRFQLEPGPSRLMAFPHVVEGGIGGSVTDPIVRIDHVQHVGSALARYVELLEAERAGGDSAVSAPRVPRR